MSMSLSGNVALITGASRGIGRVLAEHLAAAGMKVALLSRTAAQLESVAAGIVAAGGEAMAVAADVTDAVAMAGAVAAVTERWGRLDFLVNNAGSLQSVGPLWETDPGPWSRDIDINVTGVYLGCRYAMPVMIAAGGGRIVNLAGGGTHKPFAHASAYATSKAAVMRLTENLAMEIDIAEAPVKVFAVTPGLVRTDMTTPMLEGDRRRWLGYTADFLERGEDVPPTLAAELVIAIARGDLEAYHGRFLSAPQDAQDLEALRTAGASLFGDVRRLRILGRDG